MGKTLVNPEKAKLTITILTIFSCIMIPILVFKFFPSFVFFSTFVNIYLKILISIIIITFIVFGLDKWLSDKTNIRFPNTLLYALSISGAGA